MSRANKFRASKWLTTRRGGPFIPAFALVEAIILSLARLTLTALSTAFDRLAIVAVLHSLRREGLGGDLSLPPLSKIQKERRTKLPLELVRECVEYFEQKMELTTYT